MDESETLVIFVYGFVAKPSALACNSAYVLLADFVAYPRDYPLFESPLNFNPGLLRPGFFVVSNSPAKLVNTPKIRC